MDEGQGTRTIARIRHPLFILFLVLLAITVVSLTPVLGLGDGFLLGFDVAAFLFIFMTSMRMGRGSPEALRRTAARNDAGRALLLVIVALLLAVILVAIGSELAQEGRSRGVLLVVLTLTIAWIFGNLVCALHYAHMFYDERPGGGDHEGLMFPGTGKPDFWDFCYFSFVLGMTFQVSDVQIVSTRIRRTASVHALLAFFFNIGVLAMTVNVIAGLV